MYDKMQNFRRNIYDTFIEIYKGNESQLSEYWEI